MNAMTATSKGAATRDAIIDRAYGIACSAGLEGLSIGPLAQAVGMSKSGVFAHFGSREDLQLAVLDSAGERFASHVLLPAIRQPRGLPRVRALMEGWFDWAHQTEGGGCLLLSAVSEYDDRPGPQRDRVLHYETRWRQEISRTVQIAVDTGDLAADTEPEQMAFELYALALMVHHDSGLFGLERAIARGRKSLERLLRSYAPTLPAPTGR